MPRAVKPISEQDRARLQRSAAQLAAYTTFIRWSASFARDEVQTDSRHGHVLRLSVVQSSRFSFAVENEIAYLGVQATEAAWFRWMPFDAAYVSDRLYLVVNGIHTFRSKIPRMALGIFIDGESKRAAIARAQSVQGISVAAAGGEIVEIGDCVGAAIPLQRADVATALRADDHARVAARDFTRFL